jgi:excisionase family DNA binding protein
MSNTVEPNVLPASEAARRKGCTAQTIYNAIERGNLNAIRMGGNRLVVKDDKYAAYEVQETGGRLHERYQEKQAHQ